MFTDFNASSESHDNGPGENEISGLTESLIILFIVKKSTILIILFVDPGDFSTLQNVKKISGRFARDISYRPDATQIFRFMKDSPFFIIENTIQTFNENIHLIIDWFRGLINKFIFKGKVLSRMEQCFDELVVNAFEHGNGFDPAKLITVNLSVGRDHVLISVEDQGTGFDWAGVINRDCAVSSRGRGIYLVKHCSDVINYNEKGNKVSIIFFRKGIEMIKIGSYRADARAFEVDAVNEGNILEFDLSEVDYITSDGFSAIIRLKKSGKTVKLLNANEHIKETIELIKLDGIL